MIKVNCEACGAPYDVDPRRIPASGLKMRCPRCGASFHVQAPKTDASAFDIDLPAPKGATRTPGRPGAATAAKVAPEITDLPAAKGRLPEAAKGRLPESLPDALADDLVDPSGPGAIIRPEFDIDLPAAKHSVDLPAAKGAPRPARLVPDFGASAPDASAAKGAAQPKPSGPGLELDLPAPKANNFVPKKPAVGARAELPAAPAAKVAPAPLPAPALPMPTPAATTPSLASFDLDLPAPKQAAPQPQAKAPVRPSLGSDLELDLPAPKPAASPAAKLKTDTQAGGFDLDLPAAKAAVAGNTSKSFSRPSLEANLPAVKTRDLNAGMAKDSLALDPSPMFAGQKAGGALGELDEVQINFGSFNQSAGQEQGHVDLPAPSNLPAVKQQTPRQAGTMLGLGQAGKLAKDSLDIPRSFEPAPDAENFELGDLLPAPADLPQAKQGKSKQAKAADDPFADLNLPAPADLPVIKKAPAAGTMLGLGQGARPEAKPASTAFGIGQMLDESLAQPGAAATSGSFDFELDLPPPTRSNPDASGPINLERLSLPSAEAAGRAKAPFGATMALGADDLEMGGMSLHGLGEEDPFKNLGRSPSNNQTIELDGMLEFGKPAGNAFDRRGGGGDAFGELDFGLDNGPKTGGLPLVAPRPVPASQHPPGFDARAVEAELLGDEAAVGTEARPRKKRKAKKEGKALPGYVWPILLVTVIGGVGAGLGMFTHHGYFGVYLLEQLLPAAGDPGRVAAAIAQAEKMAKTDTFVDVRKSLVVLSDARNEAGLNHELLARSLLNEALYQLRFGDDAQSSQRSVAILARVMERGPDAKGLSLARAADAARRGDLAQASQLLAAEPPGRDPLRGLVAGEIALLKKQPETATKAFRESLEQGGGARAHWGLSRALIAQDKLAEAEVSAKAALSESPAHPSVLTFLAQRAFSRGETQAALDLTRKATGEIKVGDTRARPSRRDRADAFALAGQIEQALDHPREAQIAYEASLAADPVRTETLIGSGSMLMRLGRARDALSRFESALSAKPSSAPDAQGKVPLIEATVGAAQALLLLERASDAMTRIGPLSTQFAKDPVVTLWQGHTLEALEKWDEAEAAFRKTIELAPESFGGYVALSQLLFKRSRPEEGARVLAEATGKVKDSAEVRRMLGYSELTRNHLPEAIHHFEAALRFDENDAGALLGMTTAQRKSGNLGVAEKTLAKLEKIEPTFAGLTLERGQLLESRGDYASAAAAYKQALEARPHDTDLKLRLGAALVTAGRLEEAEAILPEVLKERPTSAEAEHFVGRVLLAKKETAQAVQHFERSIAFDALRAEYHLYLAWAYLDQNNLGAALTTVNKALERDPNLADARWILGRIQLRTGAVKDAVQSFQQTLKLKPGRIEAYANMGDAYDQLRDLPAAIRAYQDAVRHAPENADWWYRLGALHLDRGSRDEARVALAEAVLRGDRLIEKPTWLADAHRLYAEVLREGGRTSEAIEHYRVFLETAPNGHPDRPEVERIVTSGQR
jgi:cellulose synthase operon protein C